MTEYSNSTFSAYPVLQYIYKFSHDVKCVKYISDVLESWRYPLQGLCDWMCNLKSLFFFQRRHEDVCLVTQKGTV